MNRLHVLAEAEEELTAAAVWYESKRPGLGVELIAVVDRAFDAIREAPLACALWHADKPYRAMVLPRFPHVVFFRREADVIEIAPSHTRGDDPATGWGARNCSVVPDGAGRGIRHACGLIGRPA